MDTTNVKTGNNPSQSIQAADNKLRQALSNKGYRYVGIRGNPKGGVAVYGEAPGRDEDLYGFPFVGYSGQLLDSMMREAGFANDLHEAYFSNPYKTRPPDNDIKRIHELGIDNQLYINQFFEELNLYRPTIIIACGKTTTNLLCPETKPKIYGGNKKGKKSNEDKEGFGSWRGSLLISPFLSWKHYVIPMYHPAFVLRNYAEREICLFILQRALEEYKYYLAKKVLKPLPLRNLMVNPSFSAAYNYLNGCVLQPGPISIDIELLRRKVPYTISFAKSPWDAISMSLWNYPIDELVHLWRKMDEIFSKKRQIYQNGTSFDLHWLRVLGFSVNLSLVDDTLIRHHVLWPGLRHRLEFLGMQYTREPFWKEEGKGWNPKNIKDVERLMRYNAKDAAVTYEIFLNQEKEFHDRKSNNP